MSVPPRGFVRRATLVLQSSTFYAGWTTSDDGGGIFVLPNGPADGTTGTEPMTLAQTQAIIARSGINGKYAPEYGGGNISLCDDSGTSVYNVFFTLDFAYAMFTTNNPNKGFAGASHTVGFYYDFTDYQGPSQANVDMHFTWAASSQDFTQSVTGGRFRLEIEPR